VIDGVIDETVRSHRDMRNWMRPSCHAPTFISHARWSFC